MGSGPISLLKIHEDFPQLRILHITVIMDQLTQCSLRSISAADPSSSSPLLPLLHVLVFVDVRYARHGRNVLIRTGMEGAEILPRSVGRSACRSRARLPPGQTTNQPRDLASDMSWENHKGVGRGERRRLASRPEKGRDVNAVDGCTQLLHLIRGSEIDLGFEIRTRMPPEGQNRRHDRLTGGAPWIRAEI